MLSSYTSLFYLGLFLIPFLLVYAAVPSRIRPYVVLVGNVVFFWLISGIRILYLAASVLIIYVCGLRMDRFSRERDERLKTAEKTEKKEIKAQANKRRQRVMLAGALLNLGLLLVLKYSGFFTENVNAVLSRLTPGRAIPMPHFLLPIGISFYTLSGISYVMDVYHEKLEADRNPVRLFLFLSYFPQIMEGPICRYSDSAKALWEGRPITWKNLRLGSQRILFGLFKKIVIADRLNPVIYLLFWKYDEITDGGLALLAMVMYTIQLYMEFSGTMDVVLGTSEIIGVSLPENFRQPFFSRTISEFWTRWHITLGTWFRDYLFYPLSLAKPLKKLTQKARKSLGNHYGPLVAGTIALFAVWFCNGLWHGAGWMYLFFGMYHFVLILSGNILQVPVIAVTDRFHIDRNGKVYHALQTARTFVLVCVGEMFFRGHGLKGGLGMFSNLVRRFSLRCFADGTILTLGMDVADYVVAGLAILVVLVVDILKERGTDVHRKVGEASVPVRYLVYLGLLAAIVMLGAYGTFYTPVDPIYANF